MFSFAGDTVLDPFAGTETTTVAAIETGRNSIAVELEPSYVSVIECRLRQSSFGATVEVHRSTAAVAAARYVKKSVA